MIRFLPRYILVPFIVCCIIQVSFTESVRAWLPLNLSGNMDISYGESKTNNNNQETLQQKYSVNWSKNFIPQLSLYSSYRYTKNNLTQNSATPIWQEKLTPDVILTWNNSNFTVSSSNSYTKTNSTISSLQLSRKSWSVYMKTKSTKYPLLSLRFNRDHAYNHIDLSKQNLFDNSSQAEIHHSFKNSVVHYGFTWRYNENRIRDLKSTQYSQLLRLSDARKFYDNKLTISSNYTMNYLKQTDERPSTDTSDFFVLQLVSGLYAQTNNIELDSLSQIRNLNDGNVQEPVIPLIDIGGTTINQNIGVDFGYAQEVSAIYLYLDQYIDKRMWNVYVSSDNMIWELHPTTTPVLYNSGYDRLEIIFPEIKTRYIKVVNLEISDIEHAFVTEIEALENRQISKITKSNSSSHLANIHSSFHYSQDINSLFDVSFQHLPGQFGSKTRDNINYSFSTRVNQTDKLSHNVRFQHNMQYFHGAALDVVDFGINYLMNYKALEKLDFTLSSNMQLDYIDDVKNTNNKSILLSSKGTPLPGLNMSANLTYSRSKQYISARVFDNWNQMYSFDANVNRSLSITGSYLHRKTIFDDYITSEKVTLKYNRDQYLLGFRYRATKTIFVRSSIILNKSNGSYFSQNYMLSWNPSSKLSLSSQMTIQDDDETLLTKRYNSQLNYKVSQNANLYVSYLVSENNKSINAGFRSSL